MENAMKSRPRLYTEWRRPSRSRSQRFAFLLLMVALTGLALWLFGGEARPYWPAQWP